MIDPVQEKRPRDEILESRRLALVPDKDSREYIIDALDLHMRIARRLDRSGVVEYADALRAWANSAVCVVVKDRGTS